VQQRFPVAGPPGTVRVALNDFRWPLDPALAATRDETTLARTLYSTPLRTDAAGRVVPGLCSGWRASDGFRTWRFHCAHGPQIAGELRRVARLQASPAHWMLARAERIAFVRPDVVEVRLRSAWRRFPYALTAAAAAPRGVPGPFRLVRGSRNRVIARRGSITIVFRRLASFGVLRALHGGELDEAPVPLGDIGDFRTDRATLHVRPVLAVDVVAFRNDRVPVRLRRAYWQTANRTDYDALVPEGSAPAAFGLVGGTDQGDPAAFRRTVRSIPFLPNRTVRIAVPADPTLQYGARLLYAQWRELGLGVRLVGQKAPADADVLRVRAAYPQDEALVGLLGLPAPLAAVDQRPALDVLDVRLRKSALVIPVSWVADARWVSPRVRGWSQDVLGDVDYTRLSVH
jgi:hypothetical protein